MQAYLKIKISALSHESRLIRERERHSLKNARNLSGIFSKRHGLDEPVPEKPKKVQQAESHENAAELALKEYELFWGLQQHRKNAVRKEARDSHIALCFLRGRTFEEVEARRYTDPNWKNIERIVLSFTEEDKRVTLQRLEEWIQRAKSVERINYNPPQKPAVNQVV